MKWSGAVLIKDNLFIEILIAFLTFLWRRNIERFLAIKVVHNMVTGNTLHGKTPHGKTHHGGTPHGETPHGKIPHSKTPHGKIYPLSGFYNVQI